MAGVIATIRCPFCMTEQVKNTIFCGECGQYLLKETSAETNPLEGSEILPLQETRNNFAAGEPGAKSSWPFTVCFKSASSRRELEILLSRSICLGRLDPASSNFPEIDLTEEGTVSKSVSRRHARIFKHEDVVVVEDLGSVNGTFINGRRLVPYLPENLETGDTLQLGRLVLGVTIRRQ